MSGTPHANGGLLTRDLDLPDFRDYALDVAEPGDSAGRVDPQARRDDARHLPAQPGPVPAVLPRRDQQQPARRRLRGLRPGVRRAGHRRRRRPLARRPRHGGAVGAQLPRLARGLHPDRPARLVRHLRGVRDGERLTDDPARQVAAGGRRPDLAGEGAEPEHPAHLDCLAQRPQRVQPPGPRPDPERHHPTRQRRPGLPAPGRQLPAVGRRPLLPLAFVRQRRRHRQAAAAPVALDRRRHRPLRTRCRRLGVGRDRRRHGGPRHRPGLRRRRGHHGDRGSRLRSCENGCRSCAPAWSTSWT